MILLVVATAFCYDLNQKNAKLNDQVGIELSNRRQYEAMMNETYNDNRVLQLKLSDLSHSNDSLIQSLDETRKSLKTAEKGLKQALSVQTVIRDTIPVILPDTARQNIDFTVELKPNSLTTIKIERKDSLITCIPEIFNSQELFIYSKKEYRNPGKNFFQRLFTFDWKKDEIDRYAIVNSNPLIQVTGTRVINIRE